MIKGIQYAFFDASVSGNYTATYAPTTTITGQVTLQGRPAPPNGQWQVPITIELYVTGNPTPVATFNTTTNTSGQFTISGVPVGTYNIKVKNSHTLARVKLNQALIAGGNNIDFGTLLEGDVNNDNFITLADLSLLINSFNKTLGDPGYDPRADLNNDNFVTLADLSLLINNFNQAGENNP
jgi:2-methylaconitate cis-trans-isomerase PrpF